MLQFTRDMPLWPATLALNNLASKTVASYHVKVVLDLLDKGTPAVLVGVE